MSLSLGLSPSAPERHFDPNYRLSAGAVLRRSFAAWASNLLPFTLLSALLMLPALACYALVVFLPADSGNSNVLTVGGSFLDGLVSLAVTGAVTYGVFEQIRGERISIAQNMRAGLRHLGGVFVASLLMGLAIMAGMCALIIPGLYLMVSYWVAIPVVVVESPGATASLSRSSELTEGNRWAIFGVALVTTVLHVAITYALGGALAVTGMAAVEGDARSAAIAQLATTLALLPLTPLQAITQVVVYHDLRVGREGADVEELVKVFE